MGGPRIARLSEDWLLRGWTDIPWAAVNWRRGVVRTLSRDAFYVARSCDGRADFRSAAFLPRHQALLDDLIACGAARECEPGDAPDPHQAYRLAPNPALRGLHWSITALCNLRCRHCFMEAPDHRYTELSQADAFRLIDQFEGANVPEVALTGGEPFARRGLPALMERLIARHIGIAEITTNGVLITGRWLDLLARLRVNPVFKISFDGCGWHDGMRGVAGIEARVVDAVRRVREAGYPVVVMTSLDSRSVESIPRTYDLMKALGVREWCVGIPAEVGTWRQSESKLSMQEMVDASFALATRWREDGRPIDLWLWRFGRLSSSAGRETRAAATAAGGASGNDVASALDTWNCASTHRTPYVLPDGTLLPCGGYTDSTMAASMPNLLATGLSQAWTASQVRRVADLRSRDVAARNGTCATCEFFAACRGGCRVQALRRTGDVMSKDPVMCALWKGGIMQRFHALVEA